MVSTRSLIQWEAHVSKEIHKWFYPETWSYTGKIKGVDFYINIYGWSGHWNWTIRSKRQNMNLIVGAGSSKLLSNAKKDAARWAVVQFIRKIDGNVFRRKSYGHNTLCWLESFEREHD